MLGNSRFTKKSSRSYFLKSISLNNNTRKVKEAKPEIFFTAHAWNVPHSGFVVPRDNVKNFRYFFLFLTQLAKTNRKKIQL